MAKHHALAWLALVLLSLFLAAACTQKPEAEPETPSAINAKTRENLTMQKQTTVVLAIGDASFIIALADNEAARELARRLPLRLEMAELNGNEKYASLGNPLPAKAETVRRIKAGDVMLWGNDCLVVFYKSFDTPYSYTRIGHIADARALEKAVGKGDVRVSIHPLETQE